MSLPENNLNESKFIIRTIVMIEDILALLKTLIRFKTTRDKPDELARCADFIEDCLTGAGIDYRRFDHSGIPSILALPEPSFTPIVLMSHIDVVAGSDDVFVPKISGKRLYGRGAIDDKYAVALSLVLLQKHVAQLKQESKQQSDLSFGILITGDEEIGGQNGARRVLGEFRTDFCIALDGGRIGKIVTKEKGLLTLRLVGKGKAAHGSRPWLGVNAADRLIEDYLKVKSLLGPNRPEEWYRTMNLGFINAGRAFNQVPDRAEATLDIRYTEHDDPDELLRTIRNTIESEVIVDAREPLFFGGESPYLDRLLSISPESRIGFEHGASDARFLSDHGIPGIVWGAEGDRSAHAGDEHININSLAELAELLDRFLTECRQQPLSAS